LAGSDTYSSYPAPPGAVAASVALRPGPRRSGVGEIRQPVEQPAGHADSRRQVFVPVSNAVTGATSAFGAPSFRYWSRKGRRTSLRKVSAVSLPNLRGPRELPSRISWPWCHGPITRKTLSFFASFGSSAL